MRLKICAAAPCRSYSIESLVRLFVPMSRATALSSLKAASSCSSSAISSRDCRRSLAGNGFFLLPTNGVNGFSVSSASSFLAENIAFPLRLSMKDGECSRRVASSRQSSETKGHSARGRESGREPPLPPPTSSPADSSPAGGVHGTRFVRTLYVEGHSSNASGCVVAK
eukprot:4880444-Pleurochrysis_carterae.AAC.2